MQEIINKIMFYMKVFLLLFSFSILMYILFSMFFDEYIKIYDLILMFLPMFLVLIVFVVSFCFKIGHDELMFNISSCVALFGILIIVIRTVLDHNMVIYSKYGMNYSFFIEQTSSIKVLCYLIFLGNVLFIYKKKKKIHS